MLYVFTFVDADRKASLVTGYVPLIYPLAYIVYVLIPDKGISINAPFKILLSRA